MKKIFTHMFVDLDAVVSVWLVKRFVAGFHDAIVKFVPANWTPDSSFVAGDIAVDISAGLKGIDVEDQHHCAAWALWYDMLSPQDRNALSDLVAYVDLQDENGDVLTACGLEAHESVSLLREAGLNSIFRGLQGSIKNDTQVLALMETILDGLHDKAMARLRAEEEANTAEFFGNVAIIRNAQEFGTNGVLFSRGAKAVVFVDGNNLGVVRRNGLTVSMSHDSVRALIPTDEALEWFAHPAGFLFGRGTRKAPVNTPSKVNPIAFATALAQVVG